MTEINDRSCLVGHIQPLVRLAIVTFLVLGSIAFVPGLNQLAFTLLQIAFLYFKTGMRG